MNFKNNNNSVEAPFGFGEVKHTGRIAVKQLVNAYKEELEQNGALIQNEFSYNALEILEAELKYKTITAKHIVFAEGYYMNKNPFFKNLPLLPTKGELITIHAPDLKIDYILKGPVFLVPLEDDKYLIGATYQWENIANNISEEAKQELLSKLKTLINCSFEVIDHVAGIRPTVKDRRPLVGRHSQYTNLYLLNGLGTRGVMIAPYVAQKLFEFIEHNMPLEKDIDINRFMES